MPALLCRPSRRDALSFFTQAESAPITPTHPPVALPCRAGERWIDRVKSVAVTCDAQGRVQRYLSGSLNDTRTPSRSKELIEAVGKVIRVVGVTVNEAVGVPRPMTIMPALLFTAEIPTFAPTSVLKATVPPVTPIPAAGEGWEVVLVIGTPKLNACPGMGKPRYSGHDCKRRIQRKSVRRAALNHRIACQNKLYVSTNNRFTRESTSEPYWPDCS